MGMDRDQMLAFNAKVIDEFRSNGGQCGGYFEGNPMLLVTLEGARSGRSMTLPLTCYVADDAWIVMASAGGSPAHPAWYHNLVANPRVVVEFGTERFAAEAQLLAGPDRERAYTAMVAALPRFGEYQAKVERAIPLFALVRAEGS